MNALATAPAITTPLPVSDFMSSPVLTVRQSASALQALELMQKRRVAHLVVVDDADCVTGVLSDADLRSAQPSVVLVPDAANRAKALSLLRVGDVMSAHPRTARADWSAVKVLQVMRDTRVTSIPVVDAAGHPVGVVTGMDVVRLTLRLLTAG